MLVNSLAVSLRKTKQLGLVAHTCNSRLRRSEVEIKKIEVGGQPRQKKSIRPHFN
jgi:hypothetical protein